MRRFDGGRVRPDFTPHIAFDLDGLRAGEPVGVNGHRFLVAKSDILMATRVMRPARDGERDHWDDTVEVDLRLVHADWTGCPRIDPGDPPEPADAAPWSVWGRDPGGWWVFHEPTGLFFPIERNMTAGVSANSPHLAGAKLLGGGDRA